MSTEINSEKQEQIRIAYSEWVNHERRAIEQFENRKITLKQRAKELTCAHVNYDRALHNSDEVSRRYYFVDKYPELFTLDKIYAKDKQDSVNFELKIIVKSSDQNAIDFLLKSNNITQFDLIRKDNWLFYTITFFIERNKIMEKIKENEQNEHDYLEFINPSTSYYNSLNIPRFNFLISLTPLKNIFSEINYFLIAPFNKLNYACYLAVNNGSEIYCLRNFIRDDKIPPHYYEDLKNVFRSTWEVDIARILNRKNIKWEYEKEGFLLEMEGKSNRKKSYIPDFFLPNNVILEVKGFWDSDSVNKVYLFKKQITDYQLKIIDSDMFYTLAKKYKSLLPVFESTITKPSIETIPVVGIQLKERKPYVQVLNIGDKVILKRDVDNEYDKNAIKVFNLNGNLLGFVAKEWASIYAEKMDMGMTYEAYVKSKEPKVLNISVKRTNIDEEILYDFLA